MSRISVRGFAVASATAVTTVGAVVGVASGDPVSSGDNNFEAAAADTTLLADIPVGQQAQVASAAVTQQADVQAAAADEAAKTQAEQSARLKAASDAKAKKEKADEAKAAKEKAEKEAKEREQVEEIASRSSSRDAGEASFEQKSSYSVSDVKAIARQIVPAGQFQCFSNIVNHESTWNYQAQNPTSAAYGLVQSNPGSKMASVAPDWRTNPATQIKWGLNYMNVRYGSPCEAWAFWQNNNYY
ncbi:lytic transglycosylase domain-containing protein [Streptomyces sp. NBC_00237]|uniref:aggregation-promoting factor C-terminal-like domain-containing protein n=1 Tax=Streptomyces sp. NBC_00237 TaxID=2975687 RepID=UPI00224F58E3|nr:transglycosylase SLT domain-containing protein [Streptomyces sp. NBC_00237]MCX5204493.1 lytic transglycosylase domain-containing protein [Streptomyces sp. NBC_00237]